jgi:hydroxypyruvate isomerase
VTHIQLSQSPGRKSPDNVGNIDIASFVKRVGKDGYKGWISGEYTPDGLTSSGLAWAG